MSDIQGILLGGCAVVRRELAMGLLVFALGLFPQWELFEGNALVGALGWAFELRGLLRRRSRFEGLMDLDPMQALALFAEVCHA
jgi:hypothetical protein